RLFDFEMKPRLRGDQLPDARIAKNLPELRSICAFDDKIAIKVRMPHLDVLHAEVFAQFAKNSLAIDCEAKLARIQKRRAHPGMVVLAVFVQGEKPARVGGLDFTAIPGCARQVPPY